MDTGKEFDKNVLLDQEDVLRPKMVTVEIAGKKYQVPEGITVIKALWYSGQEVYRGIGCLGGYCGACATYYRTKDDPKVRTCRLFHGRRGWDVLLHGRTLPGTQGD